ncbi:hypothetical protein [Hydrogenophaga aquatica]
MTPAPSPWPQCLETLEELLKITEAASAASVASVSSGNFDEFEACCQRLQQALAKAQPFLAASFQTEPVPAHILEMHGKLQTALGNLYEGTMRVQAHATRALSVLFPQDQLRAYSKLGSGGYGAPGKPGSTVLKA